MNPFNGPFVARIIFSILPLFFFSAHCQIFTLRTIPGGLTIHVAPSNVTTDTPAYLSLHQSDQPPCPDIFTYHDSNVTFNGANLYLNKETKYESVLRAEVGELPWGPYLFYNTWSIIETKRGDKVLAAAFWGQAEEKKWFWCPGGESEGRVW
jgi:hypothetical protein